MFRVGVTMKESVKAGLFLTMFGFLVISQEIPKVSAAGVPAITLGLGGANASHANTTIYNITVSTSSSNSTNATHAHDHDHDHDMLMMMMDQLTSNVSTTALTPASSASSPSSNHNLPLAILLPILGLAASLLALSSSKQ